MANRWEKFNIPEAEENKKKERKEMAGHFDEDKRPMHGVECPECKKILEELPFPTPDSLPSRKR